MKIYLVFGEIFDECEQFIAAYDSNEKAWKAIDQYRKDMEEKKPKVPYFDQLYIQVTDLQ